MLDVRMCSIALSMLDRPAVEPPRKIEVYTLCICRNHGIVLWVNFEQRRMHPGLGVYVEEHVIHLSVNGLACCARFGSSGYHSICVVDGWYVWLNTDT